MSKVYYKPIISEKDTIFVLPRLKTYSINSLEASDIRKSRDASQLLNNFRWSYYSNIYHLVSISMFDKAQLLVDEMNTKFDSNKLPYYSKEQEQYFKDLFIKVSKKQN